jgi:hypothetical protein
MGPDKVRDGRKVIVSQFAEFLRFHLMVLLDARTARLERGTQLSQPMHPETRKATRTGVACEATAL